MIHVHEHTYHDHDHEHTHVMTKQVHTVIMNPTFAQKLEALSHVLIALATFAQKA